MSQRLLIDDPRPLDERLGPSFFRQAPERTGVYVMRDAADQVLYVGKAKSLRQRLRNYRIANPDRMPRRHLRLVREVARIEFEFCPGESAALKREADLLWSLKPKFNRAGVWPGKTRFLVWRRVGERLELTVADVPEPGWQRFGPLGQARARHLHQTLSRVLWLAINPARGFAGLPAGWTQGGQSEQREIQCGEALEKVVEALETFFWRMPEDFFSWIESRVGPQAHPFERGAIELELEALREFAVGQKPTEKNRRQLVLLEWHGSCFGMPQCA